MNYHRRSFLFILCLIISSTIFSQKQANVWHFGSGLSIDFNSGEPVEIPGSQMFTFEGSASYCDTLGNLLFYTNGGGREPDFSGQDPGHIWNRENNVLYNMLGTEGGGFSAAQSSVIVEAPGQPNLYYVFTMEEIEFAIGASPEINAAQPLGRGFRYFTVDMSLNGGLGGVVQVDQTVFSPSYESICAIRHSNKTDYWILINQDFLGVGVYRLTSSGLQLDNIYSALGANGSIIKATPNGEKVIFNTNLLDFNPATGQLSNPTQIDIGAAAYEFSHNSRYLYEVLNENNLISVVRFDLEAVNISTSQEPVGTIPVDFFSSIGQMQLAPDGRIYFVDVKIDEIVLHRVNCPNTETPSVEPDVLTFQGDISYGLPNFPAWIFENDDQLNVSLGPEQLQLCENQFPFTLHAQNPGATYLWSTGETTQAIQINQAGEYWVQVTGPCGIGTDTITISPCSASSECIVFEPTGATQSWTVPVGVDSITVKMWGAAGGAGSSPSNNGGGGGGYTEFSMPVVSGDVLQIEVGTGGVRSIENAGGVGGWPAGGAGGTGNRNEVVFGVPSNVGGGGGGGGRSLIRMTGSINQLLAVAGGGGGAAFGRYGGGGGGLEADYTAASNSFSVNGFGGTQTAGGAPGNNEICPPPTFGSPGIAFAGGVGATDIVDLNTGGGGGGDGYFGGGGGSSHNGCFGVGSTGGGGSGFLCSSCPGLTGLTQTAGFFGVAANNTDPLLTSYPGTATGLDEQNGGGGLVQICFTSSNDCLPVSLSLTQVSCGSYTSNSGVLYTSSGLYTEIFPAANGCDTTLTINLTINPDPELVVTVQPTGCDNASGTAAVSVVQGTPDYTYLWTPGGSTSDSISGLSFGNYTVLVTDGNGCTAVGPGNVEIEQGPQISAVPENTTITAGDSIQLTASGGLTYLWSPASGLSCTDCANPIASPLVTTTYTVTGFDAAGCLNTALVIITVEERCGEVFIPTIFSPDGSGPIQNETLCIEGNCIRELVYEIYNRWGQQIFKTQSTDSCWDGTFNGKSVDAGAYVYRAVIILNDGTTKEESGVITLIK
jgi:gliding motility-associated-like protein